MFGRLRRWRGLLMSRPLDAIASRNGLYKGLAVSAGGELGAAALEDVSLRTMLPSDPEEAVRRGIGGGIGALAAPGAERRIWLWSPLRPSATLRTRRPRD